MANGYPPPDEPETPQDMPDEPDAPDTPDAGAQPAQGGKVSQADANYRESDKTKCCGLCAYFTGSAGEGAYQCTKVEGKISPFGFSDLYQRQDNPFREGENPDNPFVGGRRVAIAIVPPAAATPMPMPAGPPPRLRIGGKVYGGQ